MILFKFISLLFQLFKKTLISSFVISMRYSSNEGSSLFSVSQQVNSGTVLLSGRVSFSISVIFLTIFFRVVPLITEARPLAASTCICVWQEKYCGVSIIDNAEMRSTDVSGEKKKLSRPHSFLTKVLRFSLLKKCHLLLCRYRSRCLQQYHHQMQH